MPARGLQMQCTDLQGMSDAEDRLERAAGHGVKPSTGAGPVQALSTRRAALRSMVASSRVLPMNIRSTRPRLIVLVL